MSLLNMRAKTKTAIIKTFVRTASTLFFAILMAIAPAITAKADVYDEQIKALQSQAAQYQAQAAQLKSQASDLQSQLDGIAAQESAIQTQISTSELKLQQLNAQIEQTQEQIINVKQALANNLKSEYLESNISPLEMVASSKSISDFIDKQEYRNKIRDAVQQSLTQVQLLNTQLAQQKTDVEQELAKQKSAQARLAEQDQEKGNLLTQTQGQQAAYTQLAQQQQDQIKAVQAAQAAAFARLFGQGYRSSGVFGRLEFKNLTANVYCGGGYPSYYCGAGQDSTVDEWQLYNRECVSYAAWAMQYRFGRTVPGFHGHGNAEDWRDFNGYNGIVVDSTPAAGTVVIIPRELIGGVGHAAVVESVSDGWMHVSQYNWNSPPDGRYSEMDLKVVPGLAFVHFP